MPLINCPACGHKISVEAEACPECGHPNRPHKEASEGPKCYACSATATTRCQKCNKLSCAEHVQSIYVSHGRGGAYELRCESCYSDAQTWKMIGWVIFGIVAFIMLMIFLSMGRH